MDTDPFRAPIFKRIDDPWIGLLVLGIFIFVSAIVALIVLCCFWRRHQQQNKMYNESFILSNKPTGRRPCEDQPSTSYETQVLIRNKSSTSLHELWCLPRKWKRLFRRSTKRDFRPIWHLLRIFNEFINSTKGLSIIVSVIFISASSRTTKAYFWPHKLFTHAREFGTLYQKKVSF